MNTFGHRTTTPTVPSTTAENTPTTQSAHVPAKWAPSPVAAVAALAAMAALAAAYIWINVLRVPFAQPMGALFGSARSNEGWAAWYVAPAVAGILAFPLFYLYFRRPERLSIVALAVAGVFALVLAAMVAFLVKNIGYTWYYVPGASVAAILSVLPYMTMYAWGRAINALVDQTPMLLLAAPLAGACIGYLMRCPLRGTKSAAAVTSAPAAIVVATSDAAASDAAASSNAPQAGPVAFLCTTVFMALFGGAVGHYGFEAITLVTVPSAGLIWALITFRGRRYVLSNVFAGTAIMSVLSSLPLALAMMPVAGGFDAALVVMGFISRFPVLLLVSLGLIKGALYLSNRTARLSGQQVARAPH